MGQNIDNRISKIKCRQWVSLYPTPHICNMYLHSTYIFKVSRWVVSKGKSVLPYLHLPFDILSLDILSLILVWHDVVVANIQ